jgi:hypothetical protein
MLACWFGFDWPNNCPAIWPKFGVWSERNIDASAPLRMSGGVFIAAWSKCWSACCDEPPPRYC